MKRLIATIALALLVVPATFAGEQSLLARVTVYWASGDAGSNHNQSTGRRLQTGDCSIDTRHIPYGSRPIFPDGTTSAAVDTGPAVRRGTLLGEPKSALHDRASCPAEFTHTGTVTRTTSVRLACPACFLISPAKSKRH